MTRSICTLLAALAILFAPAAALAQAAADTRPAEPAAADAKSAEAATEAKPTPVAEAPKPAPAPLPSVLTKLNVTFYGYVNFDALYDTTRTHAEGMGNGGVARPNTQAGENGRAIFTARNSRFGFRIAAPEYQGIKASALIETDFGQMFKDGGKDPAEGTYYPQGFLRLRQAHLKLETPYLDVVMGQTTYLFGWQSSFFPATAAMLGIAGEPFGRTPQLRLSKTVKTAPVNFEIAAGAFRPPQRDAAVPELQGGLRVLFNDWKGTHSLGAGGTAAYPMALGVSGAYRQFKVAFLDTPAPAEYDEKSVTGNGVSIDALIPIVPSRNGERGNTLTLVGTYAITSGAGDLLGGTTGMTAAGKADPLPPTGQTFSGPDVNTVTFDTNGHPKAINWRGIVVGADYYLPPSGRLFVSATFGQAYSDNVADWVQAANRSAVFTTLTHYDGNVFFDLTPVVRLVGSYQHRETKYADGVKGKNDRYHFSAYYFF